MVEIITIIAYVLIFFLPMVIIGFGNMVDAVKPATYISFLNFIVLIGYFQYKEAIPSGFIVGISVIMGVMLFFIYRETMGGES